MISSASFLLVSDFGFYLLAPGREPAPNTYRGSCSERCGRSVSQKLIGSLARPIKVELALRPVSSGLERGAELVWRSALRRPTNGGRGGGFPIKGCGCRACSTKPPRDSRQLATTTDLRISSRPLPLALPWVPSGTRLQLDGWLTHPRSVTCCAPRSAPYRMHAPGSA